MTCKDVIEILSDYLEETLGPATIARLEQHLRDCPPCIAYLKTGILKTVLSPRQ